MIEKAIGWLSRRRFKKHPLLYQLYPHMESLPTRFEKSDPSVHLYWTKDVFEAKRPRYMEVLVETLMKITEDKINETQLLQVYRNLVADNTLEFAKYYTFYNDEDNEEYTSHPCMSYIGDYQEKLISKYWYEDYRVLGGAAECKVQLFS